MRIESSEWYERAHHIREYSYFLLILRFGKVESSAAFNGAVMAWLDSAKAVTATEAIVSDLIAREEVSFRWSSKEDVEG